MEAPDSQAGYHFEALYKAVLIAALKLTGYFFPISISPKVRWYGMRSWVEHLECKYVSSSGIYGFQIDLMVACGILLTLSICHGTSKCHKGSKKMCTYSLTSLSEWFTIASP